MIKRLILLLLLICSFLVSHAAYARNLTSEAAETGGTLSNTLTARAGYSQIGVAGQKIFLNGQQSSSETASTIYYSWRQIDGFPVTILNKNTAEASFIIPDNSHNSKYTFELTVSDDYAQQDKASVSVIVLGSESSCKKMALEFITNIDEIKYIDAVIVLNSTIARYPDSKEIKVLRAIALPISKVLEDPRLSSSSLPAVLDSLGYFFDASSVRNITLRKKAASRDNVPDNGLLRTYLTTELLPSIDQAYADLECVTSKNFSMNLPAAILHSNADMELDYGDVQLYKAALKFLQATIGFIASMDIDMSREQTQNLLDSFINSFVDGSVAPLKIVKDLLATSSTFLNFDNADLRISSINSFLEARDDYEKAHTFLRNEDTLLIPGAKELFFIDTISLNDESEFHTALNDVADSIVNKEALSISPSEYLNFYKFKEANAPNVRDMLPSLDSQGYPELNTIGFRMGCDPTLGGVYTGLSHRGWNKHMCFTMQGVSGFHFDPDFFVGTDAWATLFGSNDKVLGIKSWSNGVSLLNHERPTSPVLRIPESNNAQFPQIDGDKLYFCIDSTVNVFNIDGMAQKIAEIKVFDFIKKVIVKNGILLIITDTDSGIELTVYDAKKTQPKKLYTQTIINDSFGSADFDGIKLAVAYGDCSNQSVAIYDVGLNKASAIRTVQVGCSLYRMIFTNDVIYADSYPNNIAIDCKFGVITTHPFKDDKKLNRYNFKSFGNTIFAFGNPSVQAYNAQEPLSLETIATTNSGYVNGGEITPNGFFVIDIDRLKKVDISILDIDHDGMEDSWEISSFGTLLHTGNTDSDNDGLTDKEEFRLNTNPMNRDSDGDGMSDGWEGKHNLFIHLDDSSYDSDGDGVSNLLEYKGDSDPNSANDIPSDKINLCPIYNLLLS